MESVLTFLKQAVEQNASDLFVIAGKAVSMKREGELVAIQDGRLTPEDSESLVRELYVLAHRSIDRCLSVGDDDFSLSVTDLARFRVNTYRQRGSLAAVIRVVSFGIPRWQEMDIPEEVIKIANMTRGMVLVTGPAGGGKSTTLACVVDAVNHNRDAHIITIEDPIEYLHRNDRSIISQRELAMDTASYVTALRASLRQAPDVILLGEMRDLETIQTAMTAAETGHLLIATLHTKGARNTIDRIVDAFPSAQQEQIRAQLSMVLRTVVSQQLLPSTSGDIVPAYEIMHVNGNIRGLIRDGKTHQIDNSISTGKNEGMISMDQSILELYRAKQITRETALDYSDNPDQLKRLMGNI